MQRYCMYVCTYLNIVDVHRKEMGKRKRKDTIVRLVMLCCFHTFYLRHLSPIHLYTDSLYTIIVKESLAQEQLQLPLQILGITFCLQLLSNLGSGFVYSEVDARTGSGSEFCSNFPFPKTICFYLLKRLLLPGSRAFQF
jgi:hypothetical protein